MPVDVAKREEFLAYMAKAHKGEIDRMLWQQHGPRTRLPFMSPLLTWATGGGVPMGHFCRWYGPEGSGKSLNNWGVIWTGQNYGEVITDMYETDIRFFESRRMKLAALKVKKDLRELLARFPDGMSAIIFDTEQRAERELAGQLGINNDKVEIVDNNVTEEIIADATEALAAYHIVIIDSASNAQSVMEAGLSPGEYDRGSGAKAWSRLKQFRKRMDRAENILIIVDQVRSSGLGGGAMFRGPDTAPPNVRFLRHNSSLSVEFETGKKLYLDKDMLLTDDYEKASTSIPVLASKGKEPHGLEMRCKVMKNSTGKPYRNARMRFQFPVKHHKTGDLIQNVGFDREFELLEAALHYEVVEKDGSRYYPTDDDGNRITQGKGKRDMSYHGAAATRVAISEDEDLQERIYRSLWRDL